MLFVAVVLGLGGSGDALRGWAIPTATDIAFALAVLAVIGTHLPAALRSFLLTLAVVDDLVAITIIAIFYTSSLDLAMLGLALVPLALFAFLVQRRIAHWWLLVPLAAATWALVHASGIHATVAGVLLGLTVPVRARSSVPRMSTAPGGDRRRPTVRAPAAAAVRRGGRAGLRLLRRRRDGGGRRVRRDPRRRGGARVVMPAWCWASWSVCSAGRGC